MRAPHVTIVLLALALALAACARKPGPAATPDPALAAAAGPQVARGAALFADNCARCHGKTARGTSRAPALVGPGALPPRAPEGSDREVTFATANDVLKYVSAEMPDDHPGLLSEDHNAAVVAYLLQANGIDMAATRLDWVTAVGIQLPSARRAAQ